MRWFDKPDFVETLNGIGSRHERGESVRPELVEGWSTL